MKPIFSETIDILHNKNIDERICLTRINTTIIRILIPIKCEVETFWKNTWQAPDKIFNENSSWLSELEMTYCSDVQPKQYKITKDTLKTALNEIHLGKSPGRDSLIRYWFEKLTLKN